MRDVLKSLILAVPLALTALSAPAAALPPLGEQEYVTGRLMAARVADRIRRTCPDLSARLIYAYGEARGLKRWAAAQGYSDDEIDAYLDDRTEKKRIYALAEEYLATNGAVDEAGFCALGEAEIAKKSYIGSFLY